jgi:N-acetyl-beta-hexosaminidase
MIRTTLENEFSFQMQFELNEQLIKKIGLENLEIKITIETLAPIQYNTMVYYTLKLLSIEIIK